MSSQDRRSAGRRRAWGRGPIILKFESLEGRELLSRVGPALPNLVGSSFVTTPNADWNQSITVSGTGLVSRWMRSTAFSMRIPAAGDMSNASSAKLFLPPMTMEGVGRMSVIADPQGAVFAIFKSAR